MHTWRVNNSLLQAIAWVAQIFSGALATGLGVIALAYLGFTMLTGHFSLVRTFRVLIGLFIVFGAPRFVAELIGLEDTGEYAAALPLPAASAQENSGRPNSICWSC